MAPGGLVACSSGRYCSQADISFRDLISSSRWGLKLMLIGICKASPCCFIDVSSLVIAKRVLRHSQRPPLQLLGWARRRIPEAAIQRIKRISSEKEDEGRCGMLVRPALAMTVSGKFTDHYLSVADGKFNLDSLRKISAKLR